MLIAIYFAISPLISGVELNHEPNNLIFENINKVLVFMGLAISFSTLQDTSKTQNELSRKIWKSPMKGKIAILIISIMVLGLLVSGLFGFLSTENNALKDFSIGIIILGIGVLGMLKSAIEMFEHHREDDK